MNAMVNHFPTLAPFAFVFATGLIRLVAPHWLSRAVLVYGAVTLIVISALASGVIDMAGVVVTAVLLLTAAGTAGHFTAKQALWARWLSAMILVLVTAVMLLHRAPGFDNPIIYRDLQISPDATTFDLYWNLDKALVGIAFVLYVVPFARLGHASLRGLAWSVGITLVLAAILMPLAIAAGLVAWDPKLPSALLWWAPSNLLITCLAEEGIFRGFLQEQLGRWLGPRLRHGELVAVAIAAVLFGAAHFAGGVYYVLLAAIAGVGYGLAYRYGGLLGAVLTHFLFNLIHLLLFTYPWLAH